MEIADYYEDYFNGKYKNRKVTIESIEVLDKELYSYGIINYTIIIENIKHYGFVIYKYSNNKFTRLYYFEGEGVNFKSLEECIILKEKTKESINKI